MAAQPPATYPTHEKHAANKSPEQVQRRHDTIAVTVVVLLFVAMMALLILLSILGGSSGTINPEMYQIMP